MEGKDQEGAFAGDKSDHNNKEQHVVQEKNAPQHPTVSFVITGFGKFGIVTHNPTTVIVNHLESKLNNTSLSNGDADSDTNANAEANKNEKSDNKNSISSSSNTDGEKYLVSMCRVIQTSASSVTREIDEIMKRIMEEESKLGDGELQGQNKANKKHIVLLHLGVDYKATKFQLETTAFNEASFRIPDEEGFQPKKEPIDDSLPISERLTTSLNARKICTDMEQRGFDVKISGDAGRFVCNYIYWSSLNKINTKLQSKQIGKIDSTDVVEAAAESENNISNQESPTIHSIFVHVPMFTVIDQETQFCFVENLLDSIYKDVITPKKKKKKKRSKKKVHGS